MWVFNPAFISEHMMMMVCMFYRCGCNAGTSWSAQFFFILNNLNNTTMFWGNVAKVFTCHWWSWRRMLQNWCTPENSQDHSHLDPGHRRICPPQIVFHPKRRKRQKEMQEICRTIEIWQLCLLLYLPPYTSLFWAAQWVLPWSKSPWRRLFQRNRWRPLWEWQLQVGALTWWLKWENIVDSVAQYLFTN